ncbi:MAG: hypothetical protein E5V42_00690 [Mesorhizobium sp.]|nr:MAG: hypothetical protein E5V42_00690 [Mesorhizobium sp.]TIX19993.1 MAG: hypothetical protein E5V44_01430 [Mesorhizobium sp.]TJX36795.1 MAG: hypothetical protein E5W21_28220 [Mesorhizobium sp.]
MLRSQRILSVVIPHQRRDDVSRHDTVRGHALAGVEDAQAFHGRASALLREGVPMRTFMLILVAVAAFFAWDGLLNDGRYTDQIFNLEFRQAALSLPSDISYGYEGKFNR